MNRKRCGSTLLLTIILTMLLGACGGTGGTSSSSPSSTMPSVTTPSKGGEQPVPASTNAQSSDIPDTQVFVTYISTPGGYQIDIPEGWARTTQGGDVSFVSNLNAVKVTRSTASRAPTTSSVRDNEVSTLQSGGRAVRDVKIQDVHLSNGSAVLMTYTANSDPNTVTGKQVRLEVHRYFFFHKGTVATLLLSAPVGADNVDQWARIAQSFHWR